MDRWMEFWAKEHADDLVREAEGRRLARQLGAARPSRFARLRSAILRWGFGNAAESLHVVERSMGVGGEG